LKGNYEELPDRFSDGIKKFNEHAFFECHDVLEEVWFETRGPSRRFYQGLIHLAVGFYHITVRENPKGAASQLQKGIDKLSPYVPEFQGVELKELNKQVRICLDLIKRIREGESLKFDPQLIPKIKFDRELFIEPD
jgi:predicted metal-dependent hydrolase